MATPNQMQTSLETIDFETFKTEVLADYRLAYASRQASLLGRKEVLTGKAKFGIFGDGKEIPQIAMAKAFEKGDIRSGYYRDQTFMFAIGQSSIQQFFAQLYAHTDLEAEPASAGRLMNGHFGTRFLDEAGNFKNLLQEKHSTSDISPTAGQMGRSLGIAYASKLFRNNPDLQQLNQFSNHGNEVSFVTIGNASTSEGHFWEVLNAAGVLQVPLAISIWDDGYGISVPASYQTTKENLYELISGFSTSQSGNGFTVYTCKAWDYPALCEMYLKGIAETRATHTPVVFVITEVTQPQGHSTSGSHERYKSAERLQWEAAHDCVKKMRNWILEQGLADELVLESIEKTANQEVNEAKKAAWSAFRSDIMRDFEEAIQKLENLAGQTSNALSLQAIIQTLKNTIDPIRKDIFVAIKRALLVTRGEESAARRELLTWKLKQDQINYDRYSAFLYSESNKQVLRIPEELPVYQPDAPMLNGYEILNKAFDAILSQQPTVFAIGEDVGKIGDVNQGFMGLQEKHGELRVTDTGIREMSIVGQGLGAAMRGLRPIVEIQYLDYLLYAIQILSDDVATLQYRTKGGQKAPLIVRTRGHRLEGIWHSGSPIGMIINSIRGMRLAVPRDMTRAVGFYNTLLQSDEPAIVIECLNGYRLKEQLPSNLETIKLPFGVPEVIQAGDDLTIVTYGSCCRIATEAASILLSIGISIEVIDVQTLLPFDIHHSILNSIKKTNRVLILDEDVPGGASSYIYQQLMEEQGAYYWLDSPMATLTAKEHRPAYSTDGDYFSKPSVDDVVERVYAIMHETDPASYPSLY